MGERVKTGVVLFLLYGLLFALSQLVQVVPGLSGLRLQAMLSVPYGLIFGRGHCSGPGGSGGHGGDWGESQFHSY